MKAYVIRDSRGHYHGEGAYLCKSCANEDAGFLHEIWNGRQAIFVEEQETVEPPRCERGHVHETK